MNAGGCLGRKRQLIQRHGQQADGIDADLRRCAVGAHARCLQGKAPIGLGAGNALSGGQLHQLGPLLGRAHDLGPGGGGHNVVGRAARDRSQLHGAALGVTGGVIHRDNALFAVDHGILAVRGKAHHRQFSAVGLVILHVGAAGFLVGAEQQANAPPQGQPTVTQGRQRIRRCHGGALIVHRAAAKHLALLHDAAEGIKAPAVPLGHNIQMPQHGDHLIAGAVFAPAHLMVKVHRGKAQRPGRCQSVL